MTEYWVSKKSYICKYCDIFIRDDAPSRMQHESGLKHQGNKERYLRNMYKNGERQKVLAAKEKSQMARINRAAGIANDEPLPHISAMSRPKAERPKEKDVWKNYSSAASLGFDVDERPIDAAEFGYGRGEPGTWEEVPVEPQAFEPDEAAIPENENTLKRRRMMTVGDAERDAEAEARDFDYNSKRKIVYDDDDDYDPNALSKLALKVKEKKVLDGVKTEEVNVEPEVKLEEVVKKEGFVKVESIREGEASGSGSISTADFSEELKKEGWDGKLSLDGTKPEASSTDTDVKPDVTQTISASTPKTTPAPSMFKKRKGAPAKARAREE